jgi:hypothetical protein
MKLELLKELYFFELNRKQQIEASLTLPVAVLTGLGGVLFTFARSFGYAYNKKTTVFVVALIGCTISLVWVFWFLIRATARFTYEVIPSSLELLTFWEESSAYYRTVRTDFKAEVDFESKLKSAYARAGTKNMHNNISKAGYLYKAYMGLVAAALFIGIATIPYFANEVAKPLPVQKVELIRTSDTK